MQAFSGKGKISLSGFMTCLCRSSYWDQACKYSGKPPAAGFALRKIVVVSEAQKVLSTKKQANKQSVAPEVLWASTSRTLFASRMHTTQASSFFLITCLESFFLAFPWIGVTCRHWRASQCLQQVTWEVWGSKDLVSLSVGGESCPGRKESPPVPFPLGNMGNNLWSAVTINHFLHMQWQWRTGTTPENDETPAFWIKSFLFFFTPCYFFMVILKNYFIAFLLFIAELPLKFWECDFQVMLLKLVMVSLNNFTWLKRTAWVEKVADAVAFGWDLENMHWLVCVSPALGPAFNAHALHTRQGSFAELVLMQLFPTVHFCHNLCYLQQCLLLSETLYYKPIK